MTNDQPRKIEDMAPFLLSFGEEIVCQVQGGKQEGTKVTEVNKETTDDE